MIITHQYQYSENKLIDAINNHIELIKINPLYKANEKDIKNTILWSQHKLSLEESSKVFLKHIHTYRALSHSFEIVSSIVLNEPLHNSYRHGHSELLLKHLILDNINPKHYTSDLKNIFNWIDNPNLDHSLSEKMLLRFEGGNIEALCYSYDRIQKELLNDTKVIKGR